MYLDILLLVNLSMNFLLLYTVARITHRQPSWLRLLLGALGGVIPVILLFLLDVPQYVWPITIMVTPLFMVGLAFSPVKRREYIIMSGLMFFTAFIVCGFISVLMNIDLIHMASGEPVFLIYMMMICFFVNGIITVFKPYLEDKKWKDLLRTRVQVCLDNEIQVIDAFLDTGNRVKDPFSQKPVIIVNYQSLKDIIPLPVYKLIKDSNDSVKILESIIGHSLACRFYLIPFTGLNGDTELLLGFRPDNIRIIQGEQAMDIGSHVAIGIYKRSFNHAGEIDALIPPEVLQLVS